MKRFIFLSTSRVAATLLGAALSLASESFAQAQTIPAPANPIAAPARGAARAGAGRGTPARTISAAPTAISQAAGLPSLFIVGDFTAADVPGATTQQGWGTPFLKYFDPAKINAFNLAMDGQSTRTYMSTGQLEKLIGKLKLGDTVLIQWSQADADDINETTARGSLDGIGENTQQISRSDKPEIVHSFGWYMRNQAARIRGAGATPIFLTPAAPNQWDAAGAILRDPAPLLDHADSARFHDAALYSAWSTQIARQLYAPLLDVHALLCDRYQKEGKEAVAAYFDATPDHAHLSPKGAAVEAEVTLACLKALKGPSLDAFLSDAGKAIPAAGAPYIAPNIIPGALPDPNTKLNLQPFVFHGNQDIEQDNPKSPRTGKVVLALASDSTVTYDSGYAAGLRSHLDQQLQILDLSRGGRTTTSFRSDGRWDQILAYKPDYVMIQFGHNDGTGNIPLYTADLIRFVDQARAAGIKPILVTPISRRYWQDDGQIHSDLLPNVEAMKKVAADKNVPLMDLHQCAIDWYLKVGRPATETWGLAKANPDLATAPNPDVIPQVVLDKTHFNPEGSRAIGKVVADELKHTVPDLAPYIE